MTSRRNLQEVPMGDDNRPTPTRTVTSLAVSAACGLVFGFAIEKGKGMFVLAVMSMLPFTRRQYLGAKSVFVRGLREKGFLTTLSGGALLGSGMAIAGSVQGTDLSPILAFFSFLQCPGVILAQLGSGTQNSMYTLLGALFGTLLYGILEPVVTDLTKPAQTIRFQFLYNVYGSPFFVMALPSAAVLSLVVFTLELAYPWEEEINITDSVYQSSSWITSPAWPPFVSGIAVGSLQIPVVLVIGDTLGASSSFCTITSQFFLHKSSKRLSPYLLKFQSGIDNWWQVAFVLSSIFGAFLSSILSGTYGSVAGVSIVQSFVGGALILGHGLSGIGLLNLLSISTMAAMFVGGVLTAMILQWIS
uniref:Uncharacterized protein n=1 Tax=Magallana gigas TaxID=29159 RepID=K1PMH0_MAGGI